MASPEKKFVQFYSLKLRSVMHYRAIRLYFPRSSDTLAAYERQHTLLLSMSTCSRCGVAFSCAMVDADPSVPAQPCWCTYLPAALPVPSAAGASCWCPDCLKQHIAASAHPDTIAPPQT